MKPTLPEFLARRWGNSWAICRDTAENRERYVRCVTHAEYKAVELEWRERYGTIDLPPWSHALVVEALRGLLHATCGVDEDGRPYRLSQFLPREAAIAGAVLARLRSVP